MLWSNLISNHWKNLLAAIKGKSVSITNLLLHSYILHHQARLYFKVFDNGHIECTDLENWVAIRNDHHHG